MDNENKEDQPKVQADSNSIAVGGISIGGDISGNITIGHTGYTVEQVSVLLTQITSIFQPKPFDGRCPYKGLEVFEEEDAELFFGRERLVDDLVSRMKESRTVFITGPSGSGKSSLMRAGLIHALKQGAIKNLHSERWLYETLKPGREPLKDLALAFSRLKSPELADYFQIHAHEPDILHRCAESALSSRKDQRFLLFLDQFEEVFTQVNQEEERLAFINMLAHAAAVENGRVIILFAMRSDFVSNCATYPALNELLSQEFRQIGAMQPEELVAAIALPARHVGLPIEDELIARIINDMKGEPGALPLMQFALKDLFDSEQEKGGVIALKLEDYLRHGGIHKSLERHADATFAKLGEGEQQLARSIFSGLIEIGRGTQDTKRTALFDELIPANAKAEDVLGIVQKLADARLIITDEQAGKDTVTISHEKLIDAWPWLKKLINENRDAITLQNEIASDAKDWEANKRDASYLYSGGRLVNIWEQVQKQKLSLGQLSQEFVRAGRRKQQRTRAALISGVSLVLIAAIVASVVFRNQAQANIEIANAAETARAQAETNALEAEKQAKIALARQLATQAQSIVATEYLDQTIGFLLAIKSMQLLPNVSSAHILEKNIIRTVHSIQSEVNSVAFSPDGQYVISGSGGTTRILNAATGEEIVRTTHEGIVTFVAFSPDGKNAVSVSSDSTGRVWDAATGDEVLSIKHDWYVSSVAFSPNSQYIVSSGCDGTAWGGPCSVGSVRVWEIATKKEIARMSSGGTLVPVAFSPDGKFIVSGGCDKQELGNEIVLCKEGSAHVWEALTGKEISFTTYQGTVNSLAFSQDGKYVVSVGCEAEVEGNNTVGGGRIICTEGSVRVWETITGNEIDRIVIYGSADVIAFSPDGNYIAYGGCNAFNSNYDCLLNIIRIVEVKTGNEVAILPQDEVVHSLVFSPMDTYLIAVVGSKVFIWQTTTKEEIASMNYLAEVKSVAFSPDGKHLAVGSADWSTDIWAIAKGAEQIIINNDYLTNSVALSPDGRLIAIGGVDSVHFWDMSTGKEIEQLNIENIRPTSLAFSPDGKYLLVTAIDSPTVGIWEIATGKEITQSTYNHSAYFAAFSLDGIYAVTAGCDEENTNGTCINGSIRVLEFLTGKEITRIPQPGYKNSIMFSRDSQYIMAGGCDNEVDYSCLEGSVRIWETITGKEISHIPFENSVTFTTFVQVGDKDYVLSSDTASARVWEATTEKEITKMIYAGSASSLAISPDGKYLISGGCNKFGAHEIEQYGCLEGFIQLWDVTTGKEITRIIHDGEIRSVAFSPDGRYYAASVCNNYILRTGFCVEGSARVWDINTGSEITRTLQYRWVNQILFSPDSKYMVSTGDNRDIRIRIYRPEDLISNACLHLTRNLTRVEWDQYIGDALPYQAVCENLPIEE